MKKEFEGLGIPNMRDLNICLLASWIRRYANDSDKIWRLLINFKYKTSSLNILTCRDAGASSFWQGVMWAAEVIKMGYRWRVGKGDKIRF
jgi:hypothetical protein